VTDYDGFRLERDTDRGVATITLDVPGKLNRVSIGARDQLGPLFAELGADDAVRFVVITGAGEAFTAGGDIAGFLEVEPERLSGLAWNVAAPERCPKPVIAKLRGYAFGVGLELALACDFRLVTENSQLALPEINLGITPGSGGTVRIAHLAGLTRAKEMIMRGRRITAREGFEWGLLTEVVPDGKLDEAIARWIKDLASRPSIPLTALKRILNSTYDTPLHVGLELEGQTFEKLRPGPEFKHGVEAFLEKKKPNFTQF
jgi:2-oxoglutaroyl-CoA hydrolase